MTILADPHLLVAPTTCECVDEEEFWKRVVLLGEVSRVELGLESFHWVVSQLEKLGYPDQKIDFGPPRFGRECQVAIESILTRVSDGHGESADEEVQPDYLGDVDARLCIVFDATAHGDSLDAIVSDARHWDSTEAAVRIGERSIELIFDPTQEPSATRADAIKTTFEGHRLHLVGGSPTASALSMFESVLGLQAADVHWIPSEKSKPPRNIDERWSGLDPARDVTICITGRVSHAVWEQADKAAAKAGLVMIECQTQGMLIAALTEWATRHSRAA